MTKKNLIKRIMAAVLVVVMCLSVVGCFGGNNNTAKSYNYTYRTYTSASPSNWNELTYQTSNDTQIMSYIGSSFFTYDFKYDANGEIVPGEFVVKYDAATSLVDSTAKYAEAWGLDAEKTGFAYTITLRNDLKWNDGTPIKAEDFVYTMKEQLNPDFQNYRADSFYQGGTVIVNAKGYAKQGQSGVFAANDPYSVYSEDMDSILIWSMSPVTEDHPVTSYFRNWLSKNYIGADADLATAASFLSRNFGMTVDTLLAMEGKTLAEIKADATMNAAWSALLGWWQSEPNEELHFFIAEYTFPEVSWDDVGIFVGDNEYEIVLVLAKALPLLKEDGSLSYQAAYNMSSLPLVKKDLYEANKVAPSDSNSLWTTTYNQSVDSTASWGPYTLESFQTGKQYTLVKNENWYGYSLPENEGLYQTERIICDTVKEWQSAWTMFKAGQIDGIGIDVSIADEYKNSSRAYFTPDDYVGSLQLQSNKDALKERESDGVNKTILSYKDFRNALSLAIDRDAYTASCTTSSKAGFGLFNSMHYYDVENGGVYRNTDEAKKVLCEVYGVDYTKFDSLDAAVDSITGYDLNAAREKLTAAYNAALAAGDIKETDKVVLTFGTEVLNESVNRHVNFLGNAFATLAVGTPLEGKLEVEAKEFGATWSNSFRNGAYDICLGGWSGAAWDPGYFLLAYLSPDYMYSKAWDTSSVMMEFTMVGVKGNDGEDITDTMSLTDWYDCLNGSEGCKYDFSANALEQSQRLQLIAALEKEVLSVYYSLPAYNYFGASLISYKIDYITYEYNTFMGYGGMKYMKYNFTDAEWAAKVAEQGGEIDYTK